MMSHFSYPPPGWTVPVSWRGDRLHVQRCGQHQETRRGGSVLLSDPLCPRPHGHAEWPSEEGHRAHRGAHPEPEPPLQENLRWGDTGYLICQPPPRPFTPCSVTLFFWEKCEGNKEGMQGVWRYEGQIHMRNKMCPLVFCLCWFLSNWLPVNWWCCDQTCVPGNNIHQADEKNLLFWFCLNCKDKTVVPCTECNKTDQ